ncbi:MAG: ComEC/Rec2 family competence protein [Candidatus Lambdaproteobacteria bacterium]|nr:ComEC/Rec2 family competence protein [Candidatus Lambdaproteobacteria bacterium]
MSDAARRYPRWPGWRPVLRHLPFLLALGWLLWRGARGELRLELASLLLAGAVAAGWLLAHRLWPQALLFALLLLPLAHHFGVALPRAERALARLEPGHWLRVEGTVREQQWVQFQGRPYRRVLLGEPGIEVEGRRLVLAEVELEFPSPAWSPRLPYREGVRAGGWLVAAQRVGSRLRLRLSEARPHARVELAGGPSPEALRAALRDRAAYYLDRAGQAVYLPLVLGVRERGYAETREVEGMFRRLGVSHLLAISGLHVGLLFVILLVVQRRALALLLRGQGWVHAQEAGRLAILLLVWGYIALIGLPLPAVRAGVMGTLLVLNELGGTRSPPLYVLGLAGLVMLAPAPSQFYDLSFQLSFLAFFFLLQALAFGGRVRGVEPAGWRGRLVRGWALMRANLTVTAWVTLGLWPVVAATFGDFSLLVFAGNLILVPLMGAVLLPVALLAFGSSLAALGEPPGVWLERLAYGALEGVLWGWLWLIRMLAALGSDLVLKFRLEWPPEAFFAYYAALLLVLLLLHLRRSRSAPQGRFP